MSTSILLTGMALGVLQLAVGVAVGYWIAAARGPRRGADEDRRRAWRLTTELRNLTADLSQQAKDQAEQLGRVDARLEREGHDLTDSGADSPLTSLVRGVVHEMLEANTALQQKLSHAELELESQAAEIAQHLHTSMTDALTGLPNRRALDDHLSIQAETWRKHKTPFSVVMLDVDHFKRFNDTHGHAAGDAALQRVAASLRESLRQHDIVTRYGGEEFAVILPHATIESGQAAALKAVEAIQQSPVEFEGQTIQITASAGLASIASGERLESLLSRADKALYAAKQAGRDQAWLHDGVRTSPLPPPNGGDSDAPAPETSLSPDLQQACTALSSSLQDLLGSEATVSPP